MTTPKRRSRSRKTDARFPMLTIHQLNGPWKEINGKWVQVDEIVTPSFILRRVPAKKLRSKTRVGAQR